MKKIINLKAKKRNFFGKRELVVIFVSIALTTLGIKASDKLLGPDTNNKEGDGPCPAGMVVVSSEYGGFCIDKYEASAGSECVYSNPSDQNETRINLDVDGCIPVSRQGTKPWRLISQDQAALACAKAGKRLPTNKEWLQAALGTPDKDENWTKVDCQVSSNWEEQPGLSGSGEKCQSAAGAYDMVGNVWEWVEGTVKDGQYNDQQLPISGYIDSMDGESMPGETNDTKPNPNYHEDYFWMKNKGLRGIVRGGYWNNKEGAGQYSVYVVTPPSSVEVGVGFRCVK